MTRFLAVLANLMLVLAAAPAIGGLNSWTSLGAGYFSPTAIAVDPTNANIIFAAGVSEQPPAPSDQPKSTNDVFRTTNGGASWEKVFTASSGNVVRIIIDPSTPTTVYASAVGTVGGGAAFYKSINGGTDWTLKNFGLLGNLQLGSVALDAAHPGTLWALTKERSVYKSINGGDAWAHVISDNAFTLSNGEALAVDPANGNVLVATSQGVKRSTDGGATWADVSLPIPVYALAFGASTGVAYAAGHIGDGIFKSTDSGSSWTNTQSRFIGPAASDGRVSNMVVGSGPQDPLMVSLLGCGIYKSLDGGATFSDANAGVDPVAPGSNCYMVSGPIAHSPAAPSDFFATPLVSPVLDLNLDLQGGGRYTLDTSVLPPICSLSASPTIVGEGGASTLTAYCSPAATSYIWSTNTGFGASTTGGTVSPTRTTTYTVQGVNPNGASSVQSVTVIAPGPRAVNLATRGEISAENYLIAGFIIQGVAPKAVVVRARGPSLLAAGVAGAIANPSVRLMRDSTVLRENDDWQTAPNAPDIQASGFAPSDPLESAVMMTLAPGAYTAVTTGSGGASGVGIVEVFEVDHPEVPMVNISTRGMARTGENVVIAGFVVQGNGPAQFVLRARGPSLAQFGIPNVLANPVLQVYSGQTLIEANDDWMSAPSAPQVQSLGFAPSHTSEAAILITLDPGAYTAIMSGAGATTGVGIVEVFAVP